MNFIKATLAIIRNNFEHYSLRAFAWRDSLAIRLARCLSRGGNDPELFVAKNGDTERLAYFGRLMIQREKNNKISEVFIICLSCRLAVEKQVASVN